MYLKCSRNKVEMSAEEIFRKFRPYCAVLASQPSAECLAKLAELCDDTAATELELVQDRVSFQQNQSGNSLSGAKKVCDKIWPKLQLKVLFMAKFALNKSC